ncbi:LptF/LptG family permease [Hallella colorans]|uniref:Lipopolysaccharide export system permease protein n=1 Tax=Hallella colorans TaxID=1703337 RepID=A0A2U0UIE7_9BACT|nr:LptF/LptG family permease [Hallella colorans]PVX57404.1 lipopolysaccharide export system permease protein [Hallella colorans]
MNLRIKKLDIFILRQFGLLFVGTFFICQFVLMMQFLWRYVDELIGKGLSLEVMAQFFWYMGLMLVPQALPLAILLSSLITFGNLGESSELTAIKAAGISLMQTFRSLIVVTIVICLCSFYFQNNIGPQANMKLTQLLVSMKQKSPELEIPEGVFYDGIPNCNIYVQKKDMKTGHLYGIMIYRMTQSYEDAAIILADSGMLQSTADKKHLLLSLWQGEWFENMQSQQFAGSAAVPYRRETFITKQIILDFDAGFNMADAAMLSNNAKGKSLDQINHAIDSITHVNDSLGSVFYDEAKRSYYAMPHLSKADSARAVKRGRTPAYNIDKRWERLKVDQKRQIVTDALGNVQNQVSELDFKSMLTKDNEWIIRMHYIEAINKFTLAFQCLIFFFIGASLGAIIRKGGLGVPVIVSVLVFIVYYILDNSGYRMARIGDWSVWFGKLLAPATLTPVAIFVTYKAYNDSMVFNADLWVSMFRRLLGLRTKRHIVAKEVIITQPHYEQACATLRDISHDITAYAQKHNLISPPNIINVFFRYQPDHEIARINALLEQTIDDLANTRDMQVLHLINQYPILSVKAHTRPFERKWLNILMAIVAPLGLFLYIRMWRYRLRLLHDLRAIRENTQRLTSYIEKNIKSKT